MYLLIIILNKEEYLEDLLTSNTFGLMKYLPPGAVLLPFLSLANNPLSDHSLEFWLQSVVEVERFRFWPTLSHP